MEFSTRLCKPGDEQALSLVGQATILETYAGIGDGDVECWSTALTASATCARLFFWTPLVYVCAPFAASDFLLRVTAFHNRFALAFGADGPGSCGHFNGALRTYRKRCAQAIADCCLNLWIARGQIGRRGALACQQRLPIIVEAGKTRNYIQRTVRQAFQLCFFEQA